MSSPSATWSFPTAFRIGAGCIGELAEACRQHGLERPLIVTDPGMVNLPAFERVQSSFTSLVPVFSAIQTNPVGANIEAGVEAFRSGTTMVW